MLTFYSYIECSFIDRDMLSVLFLCHKSIIQIWTFYLYYKWQVNVHFIIALSLLITCIKVYKQYNGISGSI